uniref:Calcium-binding protein n=1 Tax=Rhabditophanes sp. KR3021 TaxID=114890 RepID=A0AC35U4V6_9BILA
MNTKFVILLLAFGLILPITVASFKLVDAEKDSTEGDPKQEDDFVMSDLTAEESSTEKFKRIDLDIDEHINFDEFLHSDLTYERMKKEEFDLYDKNQDGLISKSEYNGKHEEEAEDLKKHQVEYIKDIFEEFDTDKNNKLNGNELEKVMLKKFVLKPKGDFTLIMNKFDKDQDGEWNAEEYLSFDKDLPFHEFVSAAPAKNLRKKIESE